MPNAQMGGILNDPQITGVLRHDFEVSGELTISGVSTLSGSTVTISGTAVVISGATTVSGTIDMTSTISIGGAAMTSTAAELNTNDGVTAGTVTASKTLVVGASKELDVLKFVTGTAAVGVGTILGGGTSGDPLTTATGTHFIEWRTEGTNTSGTARTVYYRLTSTDAGTADNDCLRAFHTTNAAIAGGHGAHISHNFGASGAISGLGTALRCTIHMPNSTLGSGAGNLAAFSAEWWLDGSSSALNVTNASIARFGVNGDATNQGQIKNLFHITAKEGAGELHRTATGDPGNQTDSLRIWIEGVGARYIMLWSAEAST